MVTFLGMVLLLALALVGVVMRKTYYFVPPHELKRQAEAGDQTARTLWPAVSYDASLRSLLWVLVAGGAAGGFVLLAQLTSAWVGFLIVAVLLLWAFSWLPNTRVTSAGTRLTVVLTPAIVWLLNWLHPLLGRLSERLHRRYVDLHTGIFEKEDLLHLLERQSRQPDSRITPEELELARRVLQFGDYKVRDALRPRADVKTVAASDAIGPILLDELHLSGQTSFPVKKSARSKEFVGMLQLADVGIHSAGTVAEHMAGGIGYLHENDSLAEALHAYYLTKKPLFVVVDGFNDYVGVLGLEDILQYLIGRVQLPDEVNYDDRAAIAARHEAQPADGETTIDELVDEPLSDGDESV